MEVTLHEGDSIQRALDEAPRGPLTLFLTPGVYREKVSLSRCDTRFEGEGAIIVWGDHRHTKSDGTIFSTGDSATFTITSSACAFFGVTFQNDFDYIKHHRENLEGKGHVDTQAVALRTMKPSSNVLFEGCSFLGFQDTLYLDGESATLKNCYIEGTIDPVFGASEAEFISCHLRALEDDSVFVAPSTFSGEMGFRFIDSLFDGDVKEKSVFLARGWHPSGALNRLPKADFINCLYGKCINRALFTSMKSTRPDGRKKEWMPRECAFTSRGEKWLR